MQEDKLFITTIVALSVTISLVIFLVWELAFDSTSTPQTFYQVTDKNEIIMKVINE